MAARLSEGLGALDELRTYVEACRMRGYQHSALTARADQLPQRYLAEDGLDLRVLDADCAALRGMAAGAAEALRAARSQATALSQAWTGGGGSAVSDFVGRHCNTAGVVADGVQAAADACAVLRDALWRVVDGRVAHTQEAADRAAAQRSEWLAAARAVLAGHAEQGKAGEIVDAQLIPFVDSVIRADWLAAMRRADDDAAAAYRSAIDAIGAAPPVRFGIPGGWSVGPAVAPVPAAVAPTAAVAPIPAGIPDIPELPPESFALPPDPVSPVAAAPAAPPAPPPNPLDTLASAIPPGAGGMPGLGGAGMPGRFADALSSLLGDPTGGGAMDPLPDLPEPDLPEEEPEADEPDDSDEPDNPVESDEPVEPDEVETTGDEPSDGGCPEEPEPEPEPEPALAPVPPADAPPPADAAKTPCEIAADELPQVGR